MSDLDKLEKVAVVEEVWGFSDCAQPEGWEGGAKTRAEAIEAARERYGEEQTIVWIQRGFRYPASHYVPDSDDVLEFILERMGLSASDEAPCDATDEWPDVSDEARKAIGRTLDYMMDHVDKWADKHCRPNFWMSHGEPEEVDLVAPLAAPPEGTGS
jgi:hypothetical protein